MNEQDVVQGVELFHPVEHAYLSSWLGVEPPECAKARQVQQCLKVKCDEEEKAFVPPIGPMNADFANTIVRLLQDNRSNPSRAVSFPRFVFSIRWPSDFSPTIDGLYLESYHLYYLPFYDRYVVTQSVDEGLVDCFVCNHSQLAIGHFAAGTPLLEGVKEVLIKDWTERFLDRDERWHEIVDEGLVTKEVGGQWATDLYDNNLDKPLELPEGFPEEWRSWECKLDVSFWLTAYTCVHRQLYREYERNNIEDAASTVFDYANCEIFVGYRLHPKEVIPAFEWYVSWPVQRRGSDDAFERRRPRQGDAPWDSEHENTLCTLWNDPRGMHGWELAGTSQVYMLRAGGRTKDEAVDNWYKCAKVFRRILKG